MPIAEALGGRIGRRTALFAALLLSACTVKHSSELDAAIGDASHDAGHDAGPGYPVFFDEGVSATVVDRFASAVQGDDAAPAILYPEDGTLVPPNLSGVDVHFDGRSFDRFEIRFEQRGAPSVVAYVFCRLAGSGCVFQPWREVWSALEARRSAGPYAIRMRGLRDDRVSAWSAPVSLELADEEIDGALYFWSIDPPSIRRYDFALSRRSSELYLAQPDGQTCIGCHAISRDGSRIAVGVYDDTSGFRSRVYDVATRALVLPSEIDAPLPAYGATDDILLSGSRAPADGVDRPLRIVDAAGSVREELGVSGVSADWSPDGARIVFDGPSGDHRELFLLSRASDAWGSPSVLPTPDTADERAPSFAPDSDWIGFTAMRDAEPVIVATRASDGRTCSLARAGAGLDATWMRWNPRPSRQGDRWVYWFTFSSSRGYGVFPEGERQIWMAAFDPDADPDDPSRPAFRFPGQRFGVDNFLAEWTLEARRQPCETDADCAEGEICVDGFCLPEGPR